MIRQYSTFKRVLFLLLIIVISIPAIADEFSLGYCNGEVKTSYGGLGSSVTGNTSAAIFLPSSTLQTFAGTEITKVRIGLTLRKNIRKVTVWVRKSLDGENLSEGIVDVNNTRIVLGWNTIALSVPYQITSETEGLYVGYTFEHQDDSYAVSVVGKGEEGQSFIKLSDESNWTDLYEQGVASIEAIVSGDVMPSYDLSLKSATLIADLGKGVNVYSGQAEVTNMATKDVSGFQLTVSGAGFDPVTTHLPVHIASGQAASVPFNFTTSKAIGDGEQVTLTISALDDGEDANTANNAISVLFSSFLRNVLIEEFTTESCPNCPRVAGYLHDALQGKKEYEGRVFAVCHHSAFNTDWLTQPCDEEYVWLFNCGGSTFAPALMFNRQPYFDSEIVAGNTDVVMFARSANDISSVINYELGVKTSVALGIRAVPSADGSTVTVTVNGIRSKDFNLANPLLTVYVTEDNIQPRNQQSSDAQALASFKHNHVIRAYNSIWGDVINWNDDTFTATYTFELDRAWKKEDLKFIACVANYDDGNKLNCAVENAVDTTLEETTGIERVEFPSSDNERGAMKEESGSSSQFNSQNSIFGLDGRISGNTGIQLSSSSLRKGIYIINGKKYVVK